MSHDKSFHSQVVQVIGPMSFDKELVKSQETIIVDGGANHQLSDLGENVLYVGDGDSIKECLKHKIDVAYQREKNFNDLSGALSQIGEKCSKINLYGFLGGRKDHEYANIFEASRSANERTNTTFSFDNDIYIFSKGSHTLNISSTFSTFSMQESQVAISGSSDFSFEGVLRPYSSHGLSNIGHGNVKFKVTSGHLIVFLNQRASHE